MSVILYVILGVIVVYLLSGLRLLYQYERGVVFTLGKFSHVKEPGLGWIIPIIQTMRQVDMRIRTADIPKQEVMTKDNIPVHANTVVYFQVEKPEDSIINIEAIKIQEIELPEQMKRAMAKQAEAEREKRAVIISAEGELKASENLRKA